MDEENVDKNLNPTEAQNDKTNNLSILSKIFYQSQNDPLTLSPIIKSTDDIPS